MNRLQSSGGKKESDTNQHWQAVLRKPVQITDTVASTYDGEIVQLLYIEVSWGTSLTHTHIYTIVL